MRRFSIPLLSVILMLGVSCTPAGDNEALRSGSVAVIDKLSVSGNEMITLTGLEGGRFYPLYTSSVNSNPAPSRTLTPSNVDVTELRNGCYLISVPEGVNNVSISPSDIGLESGGNVLVARIDAPEIEYRDAADGMSLGQGISEPVYIERDGTQVYEEFFRLDTSSIPDADGIAFLLALQSRNAAVNHSFGFLTESGEMISDSSVEAVLDLSEYGSVYLYLHLDVNDASSPVSATLYAVVPETISGDTVLTAPSVYMLEPSEKPMYLIVDKPDNVSFSDTAFARESGARYAEDGMRFENFFPIADNDSEIILNVESHESPVIFDYPFGPSMNSRLIPNDGTVIVERMGKKSCTFQLKEGQRIFPVIFEDSLSDVTVSVSSDSESSARFVVGAGHDSGRGYASRSIHFGESIEIESHQILEYGYLIRTGDLSAIEFTVSVE